VVGVVAGEVQAVTHTGTPLKAAFPEMGSILDVSVTSLMLAPG